MPTRAWITLWIASLVQLAPAAARADIAEEFARLEAMARERSPEIAQSRDTMSEKRAARYTAITRWLPRLDFQLSQSDTLDFSLIQSGALGSLAQSGFVFTPVETPLTKWSLNLSVPLYRRSVHVGLEQANAELDLASSQFDSKLSELDWRMRSLFGAYLLDLYRDATIQTSIDVAQTNLREARLRFELGQRTRVDVLRSEANLVSLQSKKMSYQTDQDSDLNAFLDYSGITVADLRSAGSEPPPDGETPIAEAIDRFVALDGLSRSLEGRLEAPSPEQAGPLDGSPSFRNIALSEELSETQARVSMAQEFPELLLQGSLSKEGPHWDDAFSQGDQSHSIALVLNVPIFTAGSAFSSYYEKTNAQAAARAKGESDLLQLKNDIEKDRDQIRTLRKSVESFALNRSQNEELVRLSFKSYQLGKSTLVEVLQSQNDLLDSKFNLAKAKLDLSTASRRFAWNLGIPLTGGSP